MHQNQFATIAQLEGDLWSAADNLRANSKLTTGEYCIPVLPKVLRDQRERWTEKEQTRAEVETLILDHVYTTLPNPPFTDDDKQAVAKQVYQHVWQQSTSGHFGAAV